MTGSILIPKMDNLAGALVLPWPDRRLSPNQRIHWAVRAKASKHAKQSGLLAAQRAGWVAYQKEIENEPPRRYRLLLDFYPPDKRRRDDDNLIAAFKPYRDGIAKALGIDDARFSCVANVHHEMIFPHGKTEVRLQPI